MKQSRLRFGRYWHGVLLFVWLAVWLGGCSGGDDTPVLQVSLEASPEVIAPGQSTELRWQINGTPPFELALSPAVDGELESPLTVSPDVTTTYTLTVQDATSSTNASVTVTVTADAIAIDTFTAQADGLEVTFAWTLASDTPVACTLDPGDGSSALEFTDCTTTQQTSYRYSQAGSYDARLTARGVSATATVTIAAEPNTDDVGVSGFVDEQSRNVVIILTDEGEQTVSVDSLNRSIARVAASYGHSPPTAAIRGLNAAVLGLLQNTATNVSETPNLLDLSSEFVVAVDADGNVLASSRLDRATEARLEFNLALPTEQEVALLLATPDSQGGWVCKGSLEYQRVQNQRTVASEQVLYRFADSLAGRNDLQAGAFTFNELTANLAARNEGDASRVLPSEEIQASTVPLDDAPDFQDGIYRFCENDGLARNDVLADLDWRSDIFNVDELPPETSADLAAGEAAVYDLSMALLLEPQPDGSNRLIATSPLDDNGNLRAEVVRSAADNLDATLFFTDVAFFDGDKRRFPLTPTYQFDSQARATQSQNVQTQALLPNVPDSEPIDLGVIDGGLGYISGRVRTANGTPAPGASVIIVLDGERLAFNVAVSDETGFYELLIPSDGNNDYILYGQNASGTLAGIASNDGTGVRYEVRSSNIFDQDIILDVPISTDPTPSANPPTVDAGLDRISNGGTVLLTGSATDPDGDALTVRWQVLTSPATSNPRLSTPNTLNTQFDASVPGVYRLRLSAFDGARYAADVVTVTVQGATNNTSPVVDAGADVITTAATTITLTGSVFDLDGDPLTINWQVVSSPANSNPQLSNPDSEVSQFRADVVGDYVLELSASDGQITSRDSVNIQVREVISNNPPQVNAGADVSVDVGLSITLEGSAIDPDDDPLTITWQVTSSPDNSNPLLSETGSLVTTFSADVAGDYVISLSASDGELTASDSVTVQVFAVNSPPQVSAGDDISISVGSSTTLEGSAIDPDNDPLTITWQVITRPANSNPQFGDTTTDITTFTADVAGEYILRLTASDGITSVSDDVTVTVTAINPTINPTWSVSQDNPLDNALGAAYNFSAAISSSDDYQSVSAQLKTTPSDVAGDIIDLELTGSNRAGVVNAVRMIWSTDNNLPEHIIDVVFDSPQPLGQVSDACAYSVFVASSGGVPPNLNSNNGLVNGDLQLQGNFFEVDIFGDSNRNGVCEFEDITGTPLERFLPDASAISFVVTFSDATDNTNN